SMKTATGHAACKHSLDRAKTELSWTGYKTEKKLGVKGSFAGIHFVYNEKAESLKSLLESLHFTVDTTSLNSGDAGRDANLKNMIFNLSSALKGKDILKSISGKVKEFH